MEPSQVNSSNAAVVNDLGCKSLKKSTSEDSGGSGKRKSKQKVEEVQVNKITKYMTNTNANTTEIKQTPPPLQQKKTSTDVEKQQMKRIQDLEEKIKEKDRIIAEIKSRKQEEEQKVNNLIYNDREYKKRSRLVIANAVLAIADIKRQELYKTKDHTQCDTDSNHLAQLHRSISQKEASINRLSNSKYSDPDEIARSTSCIEYIKRQLEQLRKELMFKEKEATSYKERMNLAQKERQSAFYKEKWPIVYERYQSLSLLGSGGFGEVYKCFDLDTNQYVALKVIDLTEKVKDNKERRVLMEKLKSEYEIQKNLKHPNIIRFHNLLQSSEKITFELEYCNGVELSVYLRKHRCIDEVEARAIIKQLFSVLNYFFGLKEKVIHFDLKPNNIMLCEGVVKLLDFGLSKVMPDNDDTKMELTSQGRGTLWYLPPETFEDSPKGSCKVDVWSAGVIFFELLYGRKPFCHGISQDEIYDKKLILSAKKPEFPPCSPTHHKISKQAMQFIQLCLKYDPHDRPNPAEAYSHKYLQQK